MVTTTSSAVRYLLGLMLASGIAHAVQTDTPSQPATAANQVAGQPVAAPVTPAGNPAARRIRRAAGPAGTAEAESRFAAEIELFAGETRVIPEPNAGRLAVGNGKVLSAAVLDDREILLIASEPGVSSLHIWTRDGRNRRIRVTIVPGDTPRVNREISAFLAAIPNAKSTVIGDKVVVEGDNLADADLAKVEELAKRYPQIVNFTNRIGWEKMIVMDVRVAEFPVSTLRELGLKWNATGGAVIGGIWMPIRRGGDGPYQIDIRTGADNPVPITGPGGGPATLASSLNLLSAFNLGINATLSLMERSGSAVILAQPTLSARSGTKATYLAGGEIPYTVSNVNGTTVVFKPYGIRLEIEPRVDRNGVIRAKIMSEVSDIDGTLTGTIGGPALRTRKTETEFNVQEGGTIVLSGLLQREVSSTLDKVPFLGDIPVLGALFRSKRFQNRETELVVFVTPVAVDRNTQAQEQTLATARQRLDAEPRVGTPDVAQAPPLPQNPVQPEPRAQQSSPSSGSGQGWFD